MPGFILFKTQNPENIIKDLDTITAFAYTALTSDNTTIKPIMFSSKKYAFNGTTRNISISISIHKP
jgi:hypothetical protein